MKRGEEKGERREEKRGEARRGEAREGEDQLLCSYHVAQPSEGE